MPVIKKVVEGVTPSEQFEKVIEAYAAQNPVKFAMKKEALYKKLEAMKKAEGKK